MNTGGLTLRSRPESGRIAIVGFALVLGTGCNDGAITRPLSAGVPSSRVARSGAGHEFQVNSSTAGHQFSPSVAMNARGDYLVTWMSSTQPSVPAPQFGCNTMTGDVMAQRYSARGRKRGGEFLVSSSPATYCLEARDGPQAVMHATGIFVVTWHTADLNGGDDIYAQRFGADGEPIGDEILVNTTTEGSQFYPMVAMDARGDFIITWYGRTPDGTRWAVRGQRFERDGTRQGGEFDISTDLTAINAWSTVAMDDSGDFVVAWQTIPVGGAPDIVAQRYDANGDKQGGQIRVNSFTGGAQIFPVVATDADGDFVVTWVSIGQDGSGRGVYGQLFAADGSRRGDEFQVATVTPGDQTLQAVAMDAAGELIITWQSPNEDGSGIDIFAQRYNAQSARIGEAFQVNEQVAGDQTRSSVGTANGGRLVFVWQSEGQDGNQGGVYGRLMPRQ